jgi:2-amino-4-hydroxy-6-hydroxymethyldihydropteridine diphosphokinase
MLMATKWATAFPSAFAASSLYASDAVDCAPGAPPFINAALAFTTSWSPLELLTELRQLETAFGRPLLRQKNAARALDLDIVCYDDLVLQTPALTLPHPRAHLRAFVLAPLVEIAPELRLPGQKCTVQQLFAGLPDAARSSAVRR